MKTKLTITVRAKIESMGETKEYLLIPYLQVGETTYFLNGCVWNAYAKSAKEAKENLKTQSDLCNIVDHLIDGVIINQGCFPAAIIVK